MHSESFLFHSSLFRFCFLNRNFSESSESSGNSGSSENSGSSGSSENSESSENSGSSESSESYLRLWICCWLIHCYSF